MTDTPTPYDPSQPLREGAHGRPTRKRRPKRKRPDETWAECELCGQVLPLVPEVGLCGPCAFGEATTLFGGW